MAGRARLRGAFTAAGCAPASSWAALLRSAFGGAGAGQRRRRDNEVPVSEGGVWPAGGEADRDSGGCEKRHGRTPSSVAAAPRPGKLAGLCVRLSEEAEAVGDAVKTRGTARAWQGPALCLSVPLDAPAWAAPAWAAPCAGSAPPYCLGARNPRSLCASSFCSCVSGVYCDPPWEGGC